MFELIFDLKRHLPTQLIEGFLPVATTLAWLIE